MVVGVWSNDMGFGQLGRGGIEDIRAMFVAVHPVRQLLCVVERYLSVALISVALQHRIVEPEPDGSLASLRRLNQKLLAALDTRVGGRVRFGSTNSGSEGAVLLVCRQYLDEIPLK